MMRLRHLGLVLLTVLALVLAGCGAAENRVRPDESGAAQQMERVQTTANTDGSSRAADELKAGAAESPGERKIIRTAHLEQIVTDLDDALQKVQATVEQSGGYVQSSTLSRLNEEERMAQYTLRVPEGKYATILDQLREIGKNVSLSQSGEDVTEEYVDNEARIKNLKLQEAAVQRLFDQAKEMDDILKIQQELFRIRGEIERLEGRNRYLDQMSAMTTIYVTIREVKPVEFVNQEQDSFWNKAKEGFLNSLHGVFDFFETAALVLITLLPVLVLIGIPAGAGLWILVRRSRRKNSADTEGKAD